ncbi:MAG: hypothetical protein RIR18_2324 [Pseudomonadota bacterium]
MPKVAVIGGGWSGLAASIELSANGASVTLFEAGRMLGGRARSIQVNGKTLDNGQHILLGAYTETLALMRRIGVNSNDVLYRSPLKFTGGSGFSLALPNVPVPLNLAWGLLSAGAVSFSEKLATIQWMRSLQKAHFNVPHDITVTEWLDQAGQKGELRKRLWEPLCLAALNTPCDRASAQIFANVLRDSLGSARREGTDVLIPRQPLGKLLPEPAHEWLIKHRAKVCLGHRVKELIGLYVDGELFDAVVVAVAPQHSAALLPACSPSLAYEPIATIYFAYTQSPDFQGFPLACLPTSLGPVWFVPSVENEEGNYLVSAVISGKGEWVLYADEELSEIVHAELSKSGFTAFVPKWSKVVREKRATFSCTPNLPRASINTGIPGVWQVGDHTWAEYPATLEGAVRSGLYAARQINLSFQKVRKT